MQLRIFAVGRGLEYDIYNSVTLGDFLGPLKCLVAIIKRFCQCSLQPNFIDSLDLRPRVRINVALNP